MLDSLEDLLVSSSCQLARGAAVVVVCLLLCRYDECLRSVGARMTVKGVGELLCRSLRYCVLGYGTK